MSRLDSVLPSVALALAGASAFGAGWLVGRLDPPPPSAPVPVPASHLVCPVPAEDGCDPDYVGQGRWVIRPAQPSR